MLMAGSFFVNIIADRTEKETFDLKVKMYPYFAGK